MTDHEQALLAARMAEPDRDEPRLIYADWLEENGQPGRAEFIRVQCRIAEIDAEVQSDDDCDNPGCECCVERRPLREREKELLNANGLSLWVPDGWEGLVSGKKAFRRGFVHTITCTCKDWLEHGPSIVQHQPLEKVTLSDRVLFTSSLGQHWWFGSGHNWPEYEVSKCHLPHEIWLSFSEPLCDWHGNGRWYQSEIEAMTALSAACLVYAHSHPPA